MWLYRLFKYLIYLFIFRINILKTRHISINLEDYDVILFTHNYGGGTDLYINNIMAEISNPILIIRMLSYNYDYGYLLEDRKLNQIKYIKNINISEFNCKHIILNSFVGSYSWQSNLASFVELKKRNADIKIDYLVHDYHCLCPKHNLLYENLYCRLDCLKNKCSFSRFIDRTNKDISHWRREWGIFLNCVDRIYVFSLSSKELVRTCYPMLSPEKIIIKPHSMKYSSFLPITYPKEPLHIGVVGNLSLVSKGHLIVSEVLRNIDKDILISIIGSSFSDFNIKGPNITYTGKYNREDLADIILQEKINLILFPSVWPETFSYLVSELMQLNIPVLGFDLGAQGEKLKAYEKGYLCSELSSQALLNVIDEIRGSL